MFSGPKLIFLIVAIAVVIFIFRLKKKDSGANKGNDNNVSKGESKALEMKEDPICKSYVEDTTDYKVKLYDDIYYFCSQECKDKFIRMKKAGE